MTTSEDALVIRGGTVVDGTGAPPRAADVLIRGERIAEVGSVTAPGVREIDARERLVTPGFIDPHTHYDAQVTWDARLAPSTLNGVTTAVIGNCGVGFAPCTPDNREALMFLMQGIEDIALPVMREGLPWQWQSFPQFLDFLGARRFDADVVAQVPHSAVRLQVMGRRGMDGESATPADLQAMREIVGEGLRAGAAGFSTSRLSTHRTPDGQHVPSYGAAPAELLSAATALRETGHGWLQLITDFADADADLDMLERLAIEAARPVSVTLLQKESRPDEWRHVLDRIARSNAKGARIVAQVIPRPTGILMGWELTEHPFTEHAEYQRIAHLPLAERVAQLRRPEVRDRLLAQTADAAFAARRTTWEKVYPLGRERLNYEPSPQDSVAALARRQGVSPEACAYELMLQDEGRGLLIRPMSNFAGGNLDPLHEMMSHPNTIIGLGDGGAHVGQICDSSALAFLLTHWTRDRTRGELFSVPWAVRRVTQDNATVLGLRDRGCIAPGMKADINVIDYDRMKLARPEIAYDLPGGGKRLLQQCEGIVSTLVSGREVRREGRDTGALPGRLVRMGST